MKYIPFVDVNDRPVYINPTQVTHIVDESFSMPRCHVYFAGGTTLVLPTSASHVSTKLDIKI